MSGYYSQNPTSHRYYRIIAFGMTLMSLGKQEWWGYKPNKNVLVRLNAKSWIVLGPLLTFLEIVFGYQNYNILKETHVNYMFFISLGIYTITSIKILTAQKAVYRICVTSFMEKFHLYHYQNKNNYNKKKAITMERISHYIQYFFITLIFLDALLWMVAPLARNIIYLDQIHNRTMILQGATYMWMPFDHMYNFKNWILLEIFVQYVQFGLAIVVFCVDCMTFTFMFHLIGHLAILKHGIETQDWDGLSDLALREKLQDIHNYYTFIKKNFKTFEAAFGLNVGVIFLFNLIADSLLIYQLMFDNKDYLIPYLLMALYFLTSLVILSYAAEEIRKLSQDIFTAIYSCPWETMSLANQKMLLLILIQSQPLLDFKACGLSIGYQPMIRIIKTTFSFYVMLKETNE